MVSLDRFLVEGSLQLLFYEEGLLPLELCLSKEFMSLALMPGRKPRLSQAALLEMSGYPERPQDSEPDPAKWQFLFKNGKPLPIEKSELFKSQPTGSRQLHNLAQMNSLNAEGFTMLGLHTGCSAS